MDSRLQHPEVGCSPGYRPFKDANLIFWADVSSYAIDSWLLLQDMLFSVEFVRTPRTILWASRQRAN